MKKIISIIMFLTMIVVLTPAKRVDALDVKEPISYLVPVYNTEGEPKSGIKKWETKTITDYKLINNASDYLDGGFYVLKRNISIDHDLEVDGDTSIILLDGYTLTVNAGSSSAGIRVLEDRDDKDNKLTIYSQSHGYQMGKIVARGCAENGDGAGAGIGGSEDEANGTITINGGYIEAYGAACVDDEDVYAGAGIGGGSERTGADIIINGGTVFAVGGYAKDDDVIASASGIGGGSEGSAWDIIINGGNIRAVAGSELSSGIGSADDFYNGGRIYINKNLNTFADGSVVTNTGQQIASLLEFKKETLIFNYTNITAFSYKIFPDNCSSNTAKKIAAIKEDNTSTHKIIYAETADAYKAVKLETGTWTDTTIAKDKVDSTCKVIGTTTELDYKVVESDTVTKSLFLTSDVKKDEAKFMTKFVTSPNDKDVLIYAYDSNTSKITGFIYDFSNTKWIDYTGTGTDKNLLKDINTFKENNVFNKTYIIGSKENTYYPLSATSANTKKLNPQGFSTEEAVDIAENNEKIKTSDLIAYEKDESGDYLYIMYSDGWIKGAGMKKANEVDYVLGSIAEETGKLLIHESETDCSVNNNDGTVEFEKGKTKEVTVHIEGFNTTDTVNVYLSDVKVDKNNYTLSEGSLKVTLNADYVASLNVANNGFKIEVITTEAIYEYKVTVKITSPYKVVNTSVK